MSKSNVELYDINDIRVNKQNPRNISPEKLKKLKKSITDFPEMLELRPVIINDDGIILGGNMRYVACKELGMTEIPVIKASNLNHDKQTEFIVKDNVGFGEWDWDAVANIADLDNLQDWGFTDDELKAVGVYQLFEGDDDDDENPYTKKIEAPNYEPKNSKPEVSELVDDLTVNKLLIEINNSDIPQEDKDFLTLATYRHYKFDYGRIADYYSHSSPKVQDLMEKSALVIIDFDKAIENGYVKLSESLGELYKESDNDE